MDMLFSGGMLFFITWIVLCLVVGALAAQRSRPRLLWICLSAVLSPLVAVIILYVLPAGKDRPERGGLDLGG